MSFTVEYQEWHGKDDKRTKTALLNAVVMGPQAVAYVEPADSVVSGLWDVIAGDNRTYMGTFTTAELATASTHLVNRHSRLPWEPGQEKRFGDPARHRRRRKGGRGRARKRAAQAARDGHGTGVSHGR